MKMPLYGLIATTIATVICGVPAQAAQPSTTGIQIINAADLGKASTGPIPNPTGVVKQRAVYGQGYVYGRSVNNQFGDIVIWDAAPSNNYGKSLPVTNDSNASPRTGTAIGPSLTYKPEYGKPAKSGFSQ